MTTVRSCRAKSANHKRVWPPAIAILLFLWRPAWPDDDPATYLADPELLNVGGYVLFFNAQGPLSYGSETQLPEDSTDLGEVQCHACQHGFSLPFSANLKEQSGSVSAALGRGGFIEALTNLRKQHPDIRGLYDV